MTKSRSPLLNLPVQTVKILLRFCSFHLSLVSLIYCKVKYPVIDAHYFVLHKKTGQLNDTRSLFIRNKLGNKNLKLVYCASDLDFLRNYLKIFPAVNIRWFLKKNSISYNFGRPFNVYEFRRFHSMLLGLVKVNTYYIMDDPRTWRTNIKISKEYNWTSQGYMHGRFNEFHDELFKLSPDYYLVWNDYFKRLYMKYAHDAGNCNFILDAEFFPLEKPQYRCLRTKKREFNVLVVSDDYHSVEYILENAPFTKSTNVTVLDRQKYLVSSQRDRGSNHFLPFREALESQQIDFVVGALSTCLIEAEYFGAISVAIPSKVDYGAHILRDNLAVPVNRFNQLIKNNELQISANASEEFQKRNAI